MCRFVDIASKEKVNDIAGNTELAWKDICGCVECIGNQKKISSNDTLEYIKGTIRSTTTL